MKLREDLKPGDEIEIQIAPYGEFPATTTDGEEIVQRFDRESFEKVIENWKNQGSKMIRADFDHNSEMTDDTIASGWIKDLWIDDENGLMGNLVVTESGAKALNGLDYRFGSPVFTFDDNEHPVDLLSFAFTNRPRLNMKEVYNCKERITMNEEDKKEETPVEETPVESTETQTEETPAEPPVESTEAEKETNTEDETVNNDDSEEILMEELKEILGLPAEATPEDVKASVKEMVGKLKAIAEEEITEEAEEAVNECGVDEDKKDEVINCYKQNPSLVKSVLNCFKKTPVKMVVNASEAVKPELTDIEKLKREYASLKGGKDKVDFLLAHPGMKL